MSEMQLFYGTFKKFEGNIPEDEDLYDYEERTNTQLVDVDGTLYEFESLKDLDPYGFSIFIEPSDTHRVLCYWYNGGAGIHEVVEEAIRKSVND
jgi:hypothetical protein